MIFWFLYHAQIVCDGKQLLSETLQAGQQRIGNTRLGSLVGCGVDCSLSATEAVVNKILPPTESEETGEEDETKMVVEEGEYGTVSVILTSWDQAKTFR